MLLFYDMKGVILTNPYDTYAVQKHKVQRMQQELTALGVDVSVMTNDAFVAVVVDGKSECFIDADFVLGTATLELPGNLPAGSPIEITFTLNTEGILEVSGVEKTTNCEVHATMQSKGIMAEEKVDELKEKSKRMVVM